MLRVAWPAAVLALLLAVGEVLWIFTGIDEASDGTAFAVALVELVGLPTCLAVGVAALLPPAERSGRLALVVLVGAAGLLAASVTAGVFVGDDPQDPAWIAAVADLTVPALVLAVMAAVVGGLVVLRALPVLPRATVAAVLALPVAGGLAFCILSQQVSWLGALALPIVLIAVRRRRRPERVPARTRTGRRASRRADTLPPA